MRVVRSPVAHAVLGAVDVGDALKLSGVRTVLTGADISVPPIPVRVSPDPKVPHFNRHAIAKALGIPPSRVQMHRCDAGGGFGVRGELYPEDILVAYLARVLERPVKWTEDRAEHLVAVLLRNGLSAGCITVP